MNNYNNGLIDKLDNKNQLRVVFISFLLSVGLIGFGVYQTYLAINNWSPTSVHYRDLVRDGPSKEWINLDGGYVYPGRYVVLTKGKSKYIDSVFIPYRMKGDPLGTINVLILIEDHNTIDIVTGKNNLKQKRDFYKNLSSQPVQGLVDSSSGIYGPGIDLQKVIPGLSEKVYILSLNVMPLPIYISFGSIIFGILFFGYYRASKRRLTSNQYAINS